MHVFFFFFFLFVFIIFRLDYFGRVTALLDSEFPYTCISVCPQLLLDALPNVLGTLQLVVRDFLFYHFLTVTAVSDLKFLYINLCPQVLLGVLSNFLETWHVFLLWNEDVHVCLTIWFDHLHSITIVWLLQFPYFKD